MATKLERVKEKLIDNLIASGHLQSSEKVEHIVCGGQEQYF